MSAAVRPGRALAGIAALLAALVATSGCVQPLTPAALSPQAVVLPVPVVQQDELYECGLVSLSSLCQYHRVTIPQPVREALVRTAAEREGLSGAELAAALESLGLEVHIYQGTLDHSPTGLYQQIDEGRPLLVMTREALGAPHYCLFAGYDNERDTVYLLDPRRGPVVWPVAAFRSHWERAQKFTLLAVPAGP
jgi:ABC-type bacteriocin/lantibiotic exporter with double-glycine peptidase domain